MLTSSFSCSTVFRASAILAMLLDILVTEVTQPASKHNTIEMPEGFILQFVHVKGQVSEPSIRMALLPISAIFFFISKPKVKSTY